MHYTNYLSTFDWWKLVLVYSNQCRQCKYSKINLSTPELTKIIFYTTWKNFRPKTSNISYFISVLDYSIDQTSKGIECCHHCLDLYSHNTLWFFSSCGNNFNIIFLHELITAYTKIRGSFWRLTFLKEKIGVYKEKRLVDLFPNTIDSLISLPLHIDKN